MVVEMEVASLLFISITSLLFCIFFLLHARSKRTTPHGFTIYPLLGALPDFLRHRHRFLHWTTGILSHCPTHTAVLHLPGNVHGVITANPQIVEHMLKSNFDNYPKGTLFTTLVADFLGAGIFNSDGERWKTQRKSVSHEFTTKSLRNFVMENVAVELQTRLIPMLRSAAKTGRVVDFQDNLERFAFDNICKVAFNVDPGCLIEGDGTLGGEFMAAFEDAANLSSGRIFYALPKLYLIKKFFNLGSERKLQKSIATVHEFADKIIRTKMEETTTEKKDEDLLSRFIVNSDNSVEFLRDIVINVILAGRDTTSSALTWFFWLLSSSPDVEERILQELGTIRRKTGKLIGENYGFDELREMHYLQAAISEAMRLHPPVPIDSRACSEDEVLPDGTFIGKDWFITNHTYAMGRMESIWGEDCCDYKPERWIENGICKHESPFKYPVFHGGPRMCLGKDMAYIQMKSIAASVLENFAVDVLVEKGKCPDHILSMTLRMKGGLPVRVQERSAPVV